METVGVELGNQLVANQVAEAGFLHRATTLIWIDLPEEGKGRRWSDPTLSSPPNLGSP